MSIVEAIILGIVQGLTEFIPVSSSGHLLLLHYVFGNSDMGLDFDVALHIGTLLALVGVFHKDIYALIKSLFVQNQNTQLARVIVVATLPAVVVGAWFQGIAETTLRSPYIVVATLAIVGLIMIIVEKTVANNPGELNKTINYKKGLAVGLAQVAALVPGVSRSGSTIVAGMIFGLDRVSATRFSFLLAIPITFGAVIKILFSSNFIFSQPGILAAGIFSSYLSGLVAIKFLLKFVAKNSLSIFGYYRIGLASLALILLIIA